MAGMIYSLLLPLNTKVAASTFEPAAIPVTDSQPKTRKDLNRKPVIFEENRGQAGKGDGYILRQANYSLLLGAGEAVFSLRSKAGEADSVKTDILKMKFTGANKKALPAGEDKAITTSNFYLNNNKEIENVPNFNKVRYTGIYKGIDALFYNNGGMLEYDFIVQPGTDPSAIGFKFEGAKDVQIEADGSLAVKTANSGISHAKPFTYQEIKGEKREVASRYVIENGRVGFEIGEYDRSLPLIIDPLLTYLSYLAGRNEDEVDSVDVDAAGNVYLVGATFSDDFPNTPNEETRYFYATKLSPDGNTVIYNAFFFGFRTAPVDIDVDPAGNAYIAGTTLTGFPTTPSVVQQFFPRRPGGYRTGFANIGFMAKLNSTGEREFATLLGGFGVDAIRGIAVHPNGRIYLAGHSTSRDFPVKNYYQNNNVGNENMDAFITVLNANATGFIYSSMLGGGNDDRAHDIGIDSAGNAYITGFTDSNNFPVKNSFQDENGGGRDVFVAKFNPNLTGENSLLYSTFFGGVGTDTANAIAVNPSGRSYITGATGSPAGDFPLLKAFDSSNQTNEAFISVFNPNGSLNTSTFLGGNAADEGLGISLDRVETVYVSGRTRSNDFLRDNAIQDALRGPEDAFITKMKLTGTGFNVLLSTYFGGNQTDSCRNIAPRGAQMWVTCFTNSVDLPVSANAIDTTPGGDGEDGFFFSLVDKNEDTIGVFNPGLLQFQLKNSLTGGTPDITVNRGAAGDVAIKGDFNGDGIDTVSTFNNGTWTVRNFNILAGYPAPPTVVTFGQAGDIPVTGDWNGDDIDTIGFFRPSEGRFFLSNSLVNPQEDITVIFGIAGDLPVAGDWNGDGIDSVGVFRPSSAEFFLTDDNAIRANVDIGGVFGTAEDLPIAGDFDGDGRDSFGVWRPSITTFFLTNNNVDIAATALFGVAGNTPVVGDWDGEPIP